MHVPCALCNNCPTLSESMSKYTNARRREFVERKARAAAKKGKTIGLHFLERAAEALDVRTRYVYGPTPNSNFDPLRHAWYPPHPPGPFPANPRFYPGFQGSQEWQVDDTRNFANPDFFGATNNSVPFENQLYGARPPPRNWSNARPPPSRVSSPLPPRPRAVNNSRPPPPSGGALPPPLPPRPHPASRSGHRAPAPSLTADVHHEDARRWAWESVHTAQVMPESRDAAPYFPSSKHREPGPLRILIIEGGQPGVGEFSQLLILQELSYRLGQADESISNNDILLSDHFDVIVGEGVGGMIAILAVVFELTVDQIKQVYRLLHDHLFSSQTWVGANTDDAAANLTLLREMLGQILHAQILASSFVAKHYSPDACRALVHGVSVDSVAHPRFFSTCVSRGRPIPCTVLDVLIMCLSDGKHLPPVAMDFPSARLVGSGHRSSNSISSTLREVRAMFVASKEVACIVSIGAYDPGQIASTDDRQIILDAEKEAEHWESRCDPIHGLYARFKVSSTSTEENYKFSYIADLARAYFLDARHSDRLDDIVNCLHERKGKVEIQQLVTIGEKGAADRVIREIRMDREDERLSAIRKWLCPSNTAGHTLTTLRNDRISATGEWFLETTEFQSWSKGSSPQLLFVLEGPPGVGKSYLSQLVFDSLANSRGDPHRHPTLAHFIKYGVTSLADVFGSLLSQSYLAIGDVSEEILESYKRFPRISLHDLVAFLEERFRSFESVTIVLDGIDELPVDDRGDLIYCLLRLSPNIRLFVSSRPLSIDIADEVPTQWYSFSDSNLQDMRSYVSNCLEDERWRHTLVKYPQLKEKVADEVVDGSRSLFLLTSLHMEAMKQCRTLADIQDELATLPSTPEARYEATLLRIDQLGRRDRPRALAVFQWIFYANAPLNVTMLVDAVASITTRRSHDEIEDARLDQKKLLSLCGGLLRIVNDTIDFIHVTVREFFESHQSSIFDRDPHNGIAAACLTYIVPKKSGYISASILDPDFEQGEDYQTAPSSYLEYCATFSPEHTYLAEMKPGSEVLLPFLSNNDVYTSCSRRMQSPLTSSTPLHFLSYIGQPALIRRFLKHSRSRGSRGCTPLHVAVDGGNIECIQALLALQDIDPDLQDSDGDTPLMVAAEEGHIEALSALLSRRPTVDLSLQNRAGMTALHLAAEKGHVEAVRLLLTHGADPDAQNKIGYTPLICCCAHKSAYPELCEVASVLVEDGGADVNAHDLEGHTALWHASIDPPFDPLVECLRRLGETS